MGKSLVIVESPAKAKTINKYLGRNFSVKASIGHIMDLPKKDIGIVLPPDDEKPAKKKTKKRASAKKKPEVKVRPYNPAKIFEPTYVVIPGKDKVVNDLRKAASTADAVYLAADPDREGEAICAHLTEVSDDVEGRTFRRLYAGGEPLGPKRKNRPRRKQRKRMRSLLRWRWTCRKTCGKRYSA